MEARRASSLHRDPSLRAAKGHVSEAHRSPCYPLSRGCGPMLPILSKFTSSFSKIAMSTHCTMCRALRTRLRSEMARSLPFRRQTSEACGHRMNEPVITERVPNRPRDNTGRPDPARQPGRSLRVDKGGIGGLGTSQLSQRLEITREGFFKHPHPGATPRESASVGPA